MFSPLNKCTLQDVKYFYIEFRGKTCWGRWGVYVHLTLTLKKIQILKNFIKYLTWDREKKQANIEEQIDVIAQSKVNLIFFFTKIKHNYFYIEISNIN